MSSDGEPELQSLSQQLQAVESQLEAVQQEIRGLRSRKTDIDNAIEAIENLDTGSTVQVPIGGGAYIRAAVEDIDEVIVGIGGSYATERTEDDAIELLVERQSRIDDRIAELSSLLNELQQQGQQLGEQAQQQLQRQRQSQGNPLEGLGTDEQ